MGAVSFRWKLNGNPKVVEFVRDHFVAAAVDIDTFTKRNDKEGEFFRTFRASSNAKLNDKFQDQAIYICDTAGTSHARFREHDFVTSKLDQLKSVVRMFEPVEIPNDAIVGNTDETYSAVPPAKAQIAKVIITHGRPARGKNEIHWVQDFQRDNLWILRDEVKSLASGEVPRSLMLRLLRFHMVRYYTGSPKPWQPGEIKHLKATFKDGVLRASFHAERPLEDEDRFSGELIRMKGHLLGHVETSGDSLSRFDVIAKAQRLDLYIGKPQPEVTQIQRFALVGDIEQDESAKLMPGVFQCNGSATLRDKYLHPKAGD